MRFGTDRQPRCSAGGIGPRQSPVVSGASFTQLVGAGGQKMSRCPGAWVRTGVDRVVLVLSPLEPGSQGRSTLVPCGGFSFSIISSETILHWNGTGFAPLGIFGISGGPLTLAAFAPNTELWRFLPDPFFPFPRLDWQTGVERLCILCVLVGTSMAISKVCTFG